MKIISLMVMIILSYQLSAAGDAEQGKKIAYTCSGCHGIPFYQNTYPNYHVPRLGGQNEAYIVAALKAYQSGERSHPTMQVQAASLSDQDMADIAAFFANINEDKES